MPHKSSYFVSDLHLFSRRSLAPRHEAALHAAAARAHTFVLGGDIFDFRWSHYHSPEETARQAVHPYVLRLGTSVFLHGDAADHWTLRHQKERVRRHRLAAIAWGSLGDNEGQEALAASFGTAARTELSPNGTQ